MRRFVCCALLVACSWLASAVAGTATPTDLSFQACPNVSQTIYPAPAGAGDDLFAWTQRLKCGVAVVSPGYIDCSGTAHNNSDLGKFFPRDHPLGIAVHLNARPTCGSDLGAGVNNGPLTTTITRRGACPHTSTVSAVTRDASVIFPIGDLPFGVYQITVAFPGSAQLGGTQATGTLHVGLMPFTETAAHAQVRGNAFAAVVNNSFAGRGAADLSLTRSGNVGRLMGIEYYLCGSIDVDAKLRYAGRNVRGDGVITGGTGNYNDLKGSFTVKGTYNARTGRGALMLKGIATY
jgi:hypothetical protein